MVTTLRAVKCDQITAANALVSPLLRLPGELRQQVYEYAFANSIVHVLIGQSAFKGNSHSRQSNKALGLRSVCRQLRAETHSAFYKNCTFDFTSTGMFGNFKKIPLEGAACVESIKISSLAARGIVGIPEIEYELTQHFHQCIRDPFRSLKRVGVSQLCFCSSRHRPKDFAAAIKLAFQKPDLKVYDACLRSEGSCWSWN